MSNRTVGVIGALLGALLWLSTALGQSTLPLLHAGGDLAGAPPTTSAIAFEACTASTVDGSSYTFTSHDVGPEAADRVTVVGVVAEDDASIFNVSAVTVGGDSASHATSSDLPVTATVMSAGMWYLANPSGTTENIVVTLTESVTGAAVCVWSVTGSQATPASFAENEVSGGGTPVELQHYTYTGGVTAGICGSSNTSDTWTWTGLTENVDTASAEYGYTAATATEDAATLLTANCDPSGALSIPSGVLIHFQDNALAGTPSYSLAGGACQVDDATGVSVATFSSANVGSEGNARVTVVGVLSEDGAATYTVNSVTIGGDTAIEIVDEAGTGVVNSAIYYMANPVGTTEDIVVTFSEAVTNAAVVCVWAMYDTRQIKGYASVTDDDTASGVLTGNMSTRTNGPVFGVSAAAGTADSVAWTVLTEELDTETAAFDYSAASFTEDASANITPTADWTGGADATYSVASWYGG